MAGLASQPAAASGTDPKRFVFGQGVAWGSQWNTLGTFNARQAWDQANLEQISSLGGSITHVSFDWVSIETSPGVYDWAYADHQVLEAEKRGLEMLAYTGNTPGWALPSSLPVCPNRTAAGWFIPPPETPERIADFQNFHRHLAAHFCGRVKYYEFWNEPNGCSWKTCGCGDQSEADKSEYARWLSRWYEAMKQGCTDVVLLVGGLDCNWGGNPGQANDYCSGFIQKLYDNQAGNSFDAVALHPYGYEGNLQVALQQNKQLNWTAINGVSSVLQSQGHGNKQLWLDEWGFNTSDDSLKAQLVRSTLNTLHSQYPNVFQARYLTISDLPDGRVFGLASTTLQPPSVAPLGSGLAFRDVALNAPNTTRLPVVNPGFEYTATTPQYSPLQNWGPSGAWAFHRLYPRTGSEVLGRKFGYYSAGTSETVGQVLTSTFQPNTTYRFSASVHGGGDNVGTVPLQIGFQQPNGSFYLLESETFSAGSTWADLPGASYRTSSFGAELGRPIWIRFSSGGSTDIWFDNVVVTAAP